MTTLLSQQRGVASVPIVMAFGILIVAIGVGITTLSYLETMAARGSYDSARALIYANAGARDALERVARNKLYACATDDCYSLDMISSGCTVGNACTYVSVSSGAGTSTDPKVITARGVSGLSVRSLQASVLFDANEDGEISSVQWSEITQ
jgi:hypothetical protein